MLEGKGSRDEPMRFGMPHEEFLELCALASSGSLTEAEAKKLREHLASCSECREAIHEFDVVVDAMIPELTSESKEAFPLDPGFSQEKAETSFQGRLAAEKKREQSGAASKAFPAVLSPRHRFREYPLRYEVWLPLVASAVLCGTFGILSYRTGRIHGIEWARLENRSTKAVGAVLAKAPPAPDVDARDRELAARDAALADLRREIAQKSSEIEKLKARASSQDVALRTSAEDKNGIAEERDRLLQQVSANEETLRVTQERLKTLERERTDYVIHTASLEKSVTDVSRSLQERERETAEQQDLLAKDRDIRELMAARDLIITEVYDVARTGKTEKAFGRVFYTKGKSLLFYAYDLNEQPGLHEASTYQAWGSRGKDEAQAFNLGMFYEDNVAKKRWVVKFNDKKKLDQIDTVFVTVEPHGGSERPTGKPLLYAYLKVTPNHP
jgi:predicted  nucleic acid-binding Zn-ribbon protein